jgi:hypothetical protein
MTHRASEIVARLTCAPVGIAKPAARSQVPREIVVRDRMPYRTLARSAEPPSSDLLTYLHLIAKNNNRVPEAPGSPPVADACFLACYWLS